MARSAAACWPGPSTRRRASFGDDLRARDPKFRPPRLAQYLEAVRRLDAFAQGRYGKRVLHLAVRWILDRSPTNVALWGARRPEQLAPIDEIAG